MIPPFRPCTPKRADTGEALDVRLSLGFRPKTKSATWSEMCQQETFGREDPSRQESRRSPHLATSLDAVARACQITIIAVPHMITATLATPAHMGGPWYLLALRTTPTTAVKM